MPKTKPDTLKTEINRLAHFVTQLYFGGIAQELRRQAAEMLMEGKTEKEVMSELTARAYAMAQAPMKHAVAERM